RLRLDKGITATYVFLFFAILFLWYGQLTDTAFGNFVGYINRTIVNLHQMFVIETRGAGTAEAFGQTFAYLSVSAQFKFVSYWLGIAFIAIGLLSTTFLYKRMVSIPETEHLQTNLLPSKIDAEYWILALACATILVLSLALPFAMYGYGMDRAYLQMSVFLAVFLAIGGIVVGRLIKVKPCWLMLLVLIPYFMSSSGIVDRIFGVPGSVLLSSEGRSYAYYYVYEQESYAARWLRDNAELEFTVVYTDDGGAV
ncbi:unnamed protein product, partial [marine sediment metagenome]